MITVDVKKHYHFCRPSGKPESEKGFTDEEVRILCLDAEKNYSNPRALMRVFAAETGVRAGEVVAIHKSDCGEQYVHIHRQQVKNTDSDGHIVFEEVQYTKDERVHPHNGRLVPLSARAKAIIHIASQLSGDSELLFCDKNSMMISKDSYAQNLKRACERLGISTTNNHAFRMAFNGRMIDNGISASDRALILGHSIATNEKYYSNRDKRRLDAVRQQLFCETSSETIVP